MRDSDVRAAVRSAIKAEHGHDPDTRVVEEMGVWSGSVRIDVAVINGQLCGIEIKSDRDTLQRLPMQAEIYSRVFDYLDLVVGKRHVEKIHSCIPEWWGIVEADEKFGEVILYQTRYGYPNPNLDPYLIAQLLWRDEAIAVLEARNLADGWRSKRVKFIHQRLASELPLDDLRGYVRSALKLRPKSWLGQSASNQFDMSVSPNLDPSF